MEGNAASSRCDRLVRAMTRCECAELPFSEISRRLALAHSLEQIQAETGVGLLCTACLPDLREHLAAAQRALAAAAAPRAGAAAAREPVDPAA